MTLSNPVLKMGDYEDLNYDDIKIPEEDVKQPEEAGTTGATK